MYTLPSIYMVDRDILFIIEIDKSKTGLTMAQGNPQPKQTEEFKRKRFQPIGDIPGDQPLSKVSTSIKLPIDVHEAINALPKKEKISWLRRVVSDAARKELISN